MEAFSTWESLTRKLSELREQAEASQMPAADGGRLTFEHLPTPTGVVPLILDPSNTDCVFQAASQFNCLEMVGPGVSPRQGIAIYANDPTQGPKCAIACPAGTVFRNYFVNGKGQGETQIDCLARVGEVVGNGADTPKSKPRYWTMQNGYALPVTTMAMQELGTRLANEEGLAEKAEAALQVGVHWDTEASPPHTHRVCQVYASAVPVAYAKSTSSTNWEPFARLVLRAAYDATLLVGRLKAARAGKRVRVYLTMLGGGAFGNRDVWVRDAIVGALERHKDAPIDVKLVHYGTRIPGIYADIRSMPPAGTETPCA